MGATPIVIHRASAGPGASESPGPGPGPTPVVMSRQDRKTHWELIDEFRWGISFFFGQACILWSH